MQFQFWNSYSSSYNNLKFCVMWQMLFPYFCLLYEYNIWINFMKTSSVLGVKSNFNAFLLRKVNITQMLSTEFIYYITWYFVCNDSCCPRHHESTCCYMLRFHNSYKIILSRDFWKWTGLRRNHFLDANKIEKSVRKSSSVFTDQKCECELCWSNNHF